ncbi:hypothetical protein Tco_1403917 [Tanacetum coccineum]
MKASIQGKDKAIKKLRMQISQLKETRSEADRTLDFRALDFQITQLTEKVTVLQEQNELFRAENEKSKQHYKELLSQTNALTTENENLKAQMQTKMKSVTKDHVKPTVLAPGKYAIDVEPIPPRNRNNREVHLDYLRHLKESVETLREIVEEAKVERPLDRSIVFACRYTKHSQELLEYAIGTCPKDFNKRDKKHAPTPLISKKQVTFEEQCDTSNSNTHIHVGQLNTQQTNVPVPPSTGVNCCTNASGSQPRSNTKKNKISPAKGVNKKKVEEHPRTNKSNLRTTNRVDSSSSSKRTLFAKHVIQIVLWYLDSGCSKHMTGDRSRLRNFVKKFIGTVRFENDHFGAIMGYGDYVIGDNHERAKLSKQTIALLSENENRKSPNTENMKSNTMDSVKPRVLAPGRYAIDVEPIPPRNRNNMEVYLDYLKHLKKSVETLHEIVEKAKVEKPLDRSLASAFLYTKHSQELLEYVIGTCPTNFNK